MEDFDFTAIGKAIKAARIASGLTQVDVADRLGITNRHLLDIESHGKAPSFIIFYNLVRMFNLSVDAFFYDGCERPMSSTRGQINTLLDTLTEDDLDTIKAMLLGLSHYKKQ